MNERRMSESSRLVAGAAVGAVVGVAVAYLFLTENGRTVRDTLEPIEDLARELNQVRHTIGRIGDVADGGVRAFQEFQSARARHMVSGNGTPGRI